MRPSNKREKGFSLVEVLIALVVGTVGLLGVAASLTIYLKNTKSSVYRTTAVVLAGQLSDSIRVNRDAKVAYATTNDNFSTIAAGETELNDSIDLSEINCYGKDNVCTPYEVAGYDMYLWWLQVKTLLPDPRASVEIDATDPDRLLLELSWTEQTTKVGSENQTGYMRSFHKLEVHP